MNSWPPPARRQIDHRFGWMNARSPADVGHGRVGRETLAIDTNALEVGWPGLRSQSLPTGVVGVVPAASTYGRRSSALLEDGELICAGRRPQARTSFRQQVEWEPGLQ